MDMQVDNDESSIRHPCKICLKSMALEPKIRCATCDNVEICMMCYSLGLEIQNHCCDHPYHVDTLHLPQDDSDWALTEDRDLLKALLQCGYGNEMDIGVRFMHRTIGEVNDRIDKLLNLDKAPLLAPLREPPPLVPYDPEGTSDNPPRYPCNSTISKYFAGYNAARGDFTAEYANCAEQSLYNIGLVDSDDEDSDDELTTELTSAIVEGYNQVIRERWRRKNVIKEHALLLRKQLQIHLIRRPELAVFMQLHNRLDYDLLHDGLNYEASLKRKMMELRKYRNVGVTKCRGMKMYDRLEQMRIESLKDLRAIKLLVQHNTPHAVAAAPKKDKVPLNVAALEGFEKLSVDERQLCSKERILPEIYLKARDTFVEINRAEGGLALKEARKIMKIDVNRTRKIYNFLIERNLLNPK